MAARHALVVVANRLPVDRHVAADGTVSWQAVTGGLVAALEPVVRRNGGVWIGWTGDAGQAPAPFASGGLHLLPVGLTDDEIVRYYDGFANTTLWTLHHDLIVAPQYDASWWQTYVQVNQRFADAAIEATAYGGTVWVQDYHLQLVPQMIRRARPDVRIGFFLHIPVAPWEIFAQLPWRAELVDGLLGADLLGFQREDDVENLLRIARKLGHRTAPDDASLIEVDDDTGTRRARAACFPISTDAPALDELARRPEIQQRAQDLRRALGDPQHLIVSAERLDYTKGIPQRLRAISGLLDSGALPAPGTVVVQVASPSRQRVGAFQALREEVDLLVGRINGRHSTLGRPVVHYLCRSLPREDLVPLFLAADVAMVTPLRDGMNLVAKEFVAARHDGDGALVLSEFTGAALELTDAYLVNPHHHDGLQQAILTALHAPVEERRRRMAAMRQTVFARDVYLWSTTFLQALDAVPARGTRLQVSA